MSVIKGNPQLDFKSQNAIVTTCSWFSKVYKDNKPDKASKLCWAMWMIEEANGEVNPYARIVDRDARIAEIKKAYYDVDIDSEEYKGLVSDFSRFILTKEESLYRIHVSKFEELTAFLGHLSLDVDKEFDKYLKIMEKLDKMWKGLEMIRENMIDVGNKNKIRGNAQLSAREKRHK